MVDRDKLNAEFDGHRIYSNNKKEASALYENSRFGELKDKKIVYSSFETLYLLEREKVSLKKGKKKITFDAFVKIISETEPNFWVRYCVYKDLRARGYIVKTALKFGADFRVYDKGVKPGEDHAKWIVYPVAEASILTWYDFAAKNRVAHSTRKRLLIAIVDEEDSVTYYEVKWTRP